MADKQKPPTRGAKAADTVAPDPLFPSVRPPVYGQNDYSFLMQSIFEIQKTQGQLMESVQWLRDAQKETSAKVTTVQEKVHTAYITVWVVGIMITAALGFAGWAITSTIRLLPTILRR